jgi:hypothetical protein
VRLKRAALKLAKMPRGAKKVMYRALASALRDEISEIRRESKQAYLSINQKCQRRQWPDWLRHKAGAGDLEALAALRRSKPTRDVAGDRIKGNVLLQSPATGRRHDSVTKQGTIIYRVGASAIRDEGDMLRISRGAEQDAMQTALRMAVERFGQKITVNGSDPFKEQIIIAAATANLPIIFEDPALERRRLQLANSTTTSENAIHSASMRPPAPRDNEALGPVTAATIPAQKLRAPPETKRAVRARSSR